MDSTFTQKLFSSMVIKKRIASVFDDFIILDHQYKVVCISHNVMRAVGVTYDAVIEQPLSIQTDVGSLTDFLKHRLACGYFSHEEVGIVVNGTTIVEQFSVSAFYLGLVSDANGLIIVKLSRDQNSEMEQLEEVDHFVYSSSHALRGPLATMKGLLNLVSGKHFDDIEFCLDQLKHHANILDDRLHKLIYFAEADKTEERAPRPVSMVEFIDYVQCQLNDFRVNYPIKLISSKVVKDRVIEQGGMVMALFNNIINFLYQQPIRENAEMSINMRRLADMSQFVVVLRDVTWSPWIKERLLARYHNYSEILNYPELINYYAICKIIAKVEGEIQFIFTGDELVILIAVPNQKVT